MVGWVFCCINIMPQAGVIFFSYQLDTICDEHVEPTYLIINVSQYHLGICPEELFIYSILGILVTLVSATLALAITKLQ